MTKPFWTILQKKQHNCGWCHDGRLQPPTPTVSNSNGLRGFSHIHCRMNAFKYDFFWNIAGRQVCFFHIQIRWNGHRCSQNTLQVVGYVASHASKQYLSANWFGWRRLIEVNDENQHVHFYEVHQGHWVSTGSRVSTWQCMVYWHVFCLLAGHFDVTFCARNIHAELFITWFLDANFFTGVPVFWIFCAVSE